jgi:hypothetical protein
MRGSRQCGRGFKPIRRLVDLGLMAKKVNEKDDFEQADAAASAALEYARTLPPGVARSQAFKEAGKLRSVADRLRAPKFAPRGRRPK